MPTSVSIPRDSQAKLQHILRVSARIFADQGFEATSIRDISRATEVSLSGLYYYFESKQHLLYLIQSTTFKVVLDNLRSQLQGACEPVESLRLLVFNHMEYFLSHPNEMKVLSHEEEALLAPYREKVDAIKRSYYALAREIFDAIAAEGLSRVINPRVAVLSLFGMMNWTYKWHKPGLDPDAQELTAAIVGIFLHGIVPQTPSARSALSREVGAATRT